MYPPKYSKSHPCAYYCNKNSIVALNTLYIFIALLLIGITVYARVTAQITNLPILGGVIACGVFLLMIAIFGMIGAIKHSQVILFFYMVILLLLFIIQLSVSVGALAVTRNQQEQLMNKGWAKLSPSLKSKIQGVKDCCGYKNFTQLDGPMGHPDCSLLKCCSSLAKEPCSECTNCFDKLKDSVNHLLKVAGGFGLFFSFTLLAGSCFTRRLRNRKKHTV
ncbi:tetraspanin-31-A isoform X2 [Nematostella vectensis]|uniref:tetraspanin-31-A isoform X2 n=1 Tax=Nematostella vectensis TaxID=45351 RepID=UPI00138FCB36|nr:tetraspanin-31-A isoform X2 [Nematostella vectensis]